MYGSFILAGIVLSIALIVIICTIFWLIGKLAIDWIRFCNKYYNEAKIEVIKQKSTEKTVLLDIDVLPADRI